MENLTIEFKTSEKLSVQLSLNEIFEQFREEIYERLGEQIPCTCNINESTNFCECGDPFEDKDIFIVGFVVYNKDEKLTDNSLLNVPL